MMVKIKQQKKTLQEFQVKSQTSSGMQAVRTAISQTLALSGELLLFYCEALLIALHVEVKVVILYFLKTQVESSHRKRI